MMSKKVIFVDDEPVVLKLMKTRLETRGFTVETASSGLEAITKAQAWNPDIILLDVIMPDLDGFETCRRLKALQETKDIPVFLFTASQDGKLDNMARESGATGVIHKPHVEQLLEIISDLFPE